MPKTAPKKNRNKTARHRAKLKAKHTKARMRARGELTKRHSTRPNGGRLRR